MGSCNNIHGDFLLNMKRLLCATIDIIDIATVLVSSLALLVFLWGLVKFISQAGDPEAVKSGKSIMIWGVVALFVMVSIWGIVNFIQVALDLETETRNNQTEEEDPWLDPAGEMEI